LAERLPEDAEVRQWQAISYQLWGRALIAQKQMLKARIYLKKALKTDPNNKSFSTLRNFALTFANLCVSIYLLISPASANPRPVENLPNRLSANTEPIKDTCKF
jgi:tetratricopeptide (TPR) repeat protein